MFHTSFDRLLTSLMDRMIKIFFCPPDLCLFSGDVIGCSEINSHWTCQKPVKNLYKKLCRVATVGHQDCKESGSILDLTSNQEHEFCFFLVLKEKLWIFTYQMHCKNIPQNILKHVIVNTQALGKTEKKFILDLKSNQELAQTPLCVVANHSKLVWSSMGHRKLSLTKSKKILHANYSTN